MRKGGRGRLISVVMEEFDEEEEEEEEERRRKRKCLGEGEELVVSRLSLAS
jgi:hypothetical protein